MRGAPTGGGRLCSAGQFGVGDGRARGDRPHGLGSSLAGREMCATSTALGFCRGNAVAFAGKRAEAAPDRRPRERRRDRRERSAWVGGKEGFLVRDLNGDGVINDRREMFGNVLGFANGFDHLAALDGDGSGRLDGKDEAWADLRVWIDANTDGVTDRGELRTLAQLGITSIDVRAAEVHETIEGQWISHRASFTRGGKTRSIADVWFQTAGLSGGRKVALPAAPYAAPATLLATPGGASPFRAPVDPLRLWR